MNHLLTAALLCVPLLAGGCKTYHPALFNRGAGLSESRVLVVPFSELRHSMWYNESPRGALIVSTLKRWVNANWAASFPDSYDEKKIIDKVTDWPGERISSEDWKNLVADAAIDYVVVGDLSDLRMRNPREVNLLSPSATVRYRVIDTRRGREIFKNDTKATVGGFRDELQIPTLDLGGDTAARERLLLISLGQKIGKELYGYYSDW